MKNIYPIQEGIFPTIHAVFSLTAKLQRSYMKRSKKHEGRWPKKELFVIAAAYRLFKEKNPGRKTDFTKLVKWLQDEYDTTKYDFNMAKLYKWRSGKPFKEMEWQEVWDNLKIAYEISCNGASKGKMSQRDIMIAHSISKQDLKDLTGFILSQHAGNKKIGKNFIFDRPDK